MAQTETKHELTSEACEKITQIIKAREGQEGSLINILHETQEYLGYIPYSAQKFIAELTGVPLAEIYGVVTFYSRFTTEPVGKYKVAVCLGTACYVKGSDKVLEKVEQCLKIKAGQTSEDGMYSISATRCIGACGLAPVMTVNEDVYGKLLPEQVADILKKYEE
ncbi:MAG: NADH-quinone oxidoreductase subunit NuoE [Clostridiales bacterium]|jgi:NADP-reducing hydrogenase subunit HndA|nr:NADH-quinone oxidoreductase subunit NuoE [Clostridiales bacterium]